MRIALVHDFLTQLGGAERLLQVFHQMFPDAPVFTLVYDERKTAGRFRGWDIRASFLQRFSRVVNYKWLLPLMPRAIESFDFAGFDLVLSDSSAFAKGIKVHAPAVHICYCHTPTRYLWQEPDEYVAKLGIIFFLKPLVQLYLMKILRKWDYRAAQRPDLLIANSREVQTRIQKFYGRGSTVVYPPLDTDFFRPTIPKADYFLTATRLEPYKRVELVIEVFNELGWPLKIAGSGSAFEGLKALAKNNVEFLGRVGDEKLRDLYSGARAFIFPALEDAGLVVLESLACGTPVIAYGRGGVSEFVRDGENGVLFDEQSAPSIRQALQRFEARVFSGESLRAGAEAFGKEKFISAIQAIVSKAI